MKFGRALPTSDNSNLKKSEKSMDTSYSLVSDEIFYTSCCTVHVEKSTTVTIIHTRITQFFSAYSSGTTACAPGARPAQHPPHLRAPGQAAGTPDSDPIHQATTGPHMFSLNSQQSEISNTALKEGTDMKDVSTFQQP